MSSFSVLAETTAIATQRQVARGSWLHWLEAWRGVRRARTSQRQLVERLSAMSDQELRDIDVDPASLTSTTIRLAQQSPAVLTFCMLSSGGRA
jgi:hypothetical protein